jgi:hypothetical protein
MQFSRSGLRALAAGDDPRRQEKSLRYEHTNTNIAKPTAFRCAAQNVATTVRRTIVCQRS